MRGLDCTPPAGTAWTTCRLRLTLETAVRAEMHEREGREKVEEESGRRERERC